MLVGYRPWQLLTGQGGHDVHVVRAVADCQPLHRVQVVRGQNDLGQDFARELRPLLVGQQRVIDVVVQPEPALLAGVRARRLHLSRWPPRRPFGLMVWNARRVRIQVGDVRLYFDVDGCELVPDGPTLRRRPTVVVLHGGPGADHSLFKPEFAAVARFAQVIYLDQRGSGRSDRGRPEQWTWVPWADDVIAFCDSLAIDSPVLLGTSSGGWVALTAALRHPSRVGGLVLDSVMPAAVDERLAVMERLGGKEARQVAQRYWSGEDSDDIRDAWNRVCLPLYSRQHRPPSLEQRMQRIMWNHDVLEHFRQVSAAQFDPWDHLDHVICPTLILAGEHDPVATASAARRLAASLPNADTHLEVFPNAGHGVFREVPEQAIAALKNFLAG